MSEFVTKCMYECMTLCVYVICMQTCICIHV